ncbi:MAG: deoxyribodipyrimidine photolyase [Actinobacteria bacterium]|nr:deoxyribodipyrimidine photolyase [Actinomycetota bacterium]
MSRLIYIPFDQLNVERGAMRVADKGTDVIVLIESQRMLTTRPWHKQRLHFLISSARHFAEQLRADGWNVDYRKAATTVEGLEAVRTSTGIRNIVCAQPNSFRLSEQLTAIGATFVDNDFFLTPREVFQAWASTQSSFTMENFYRAQRRRLNILMDGDKPVGGTWNYDAENRLPPPKQHDWGPELYFEFDDIDEQVRNELPDSTWGELNTKVWGTTRAEARAQMEHFFTHHFADFGPYEDAMPNQSWRAHHSLLSPYLNNGLLLASEVIDAALERFSHSDIPIASCEGFIRQVIGWREYVYGMYWYLGENYRENNHLNAHRRLLPLFTDSSKTHMNCVRSVVADVHERGWTHHIPRLMVLSNLALLTGTSPQEFLDWMREVFVDAAEWVMVPNVIGMGTHADAGVLMTKPYASGGAYISKMGQFCKGCAYDPKQRTGENACPFTTLYWDFLARHESEFSSNHRMFQQMAGLRRLSDIDSVRVRAHEVLDGLEQGRI